MWWWKWFNLPTRHWFLEIIVKCCRNSKLWGENVIPPEIMRRRGYPPEIMYQRKCRSLFTTKRELEKISRDNCEAKNPLTQERKLITWQAPGASRMYAKVGIFCEKVASQIQKGLEKSRASYSMLWPQSLWLHVPLPENIQPIISTTLACDNTDRLEETLCGTRTSHRVNGIAVQARRWPNPVSRAKSRFEQNKLSINYYNQVCHVHAQFQDNRYLIS